MPRQSKYYAELEKNLKKQLHELQKQLPLYTKPYLDDRELSKQPRTAIANTRDLITFFEWLHEENPLCRSLSVKEIPMDILEKLDFNDINDFQRYLSYSDGIKSHDNSASGINRRMATVRTFFRFLVQHRYLENDPTIGAAKAPKQKRRPIDRLSNEEAKDLLDHVEASLSGTERSRAFRVKTQLRDTAICTLLLNTGIRVSECVGLDLKDINFESHSFRVVRKGGGIDEIYFNHSVSQALEDYINLERPKYISSEDEPALFLSMQKRRMTARSVEILIKQYGQVLFPDQRMYPHKMRKTYGTALYNATGDIALVASALGHKSINTTRDHYAALDENRAKATSEFDPFS